MVSGTEKRKIQEGKNIQKEISPRKAESKTSQEWRNGLSKGKITKGDNGRRRQSGKKNEGEGGERIIGEH